MADFLSAGLDLARGMALSIMNEKTSESAGIPAEARELLEKNFGAQGSWWQCQTSGEEPRWEVMDAWTRGLGA